MNHPPPTRSLHRFLPLLLAALLLAGGCAVNPVTGERELSVVGEQWELDVGARQYAPLRQAQGGDFVLDPGLVDYVQGVGQRLAAHAERDLPYEFEVINESVPNAWALPGGKIAINRGLLAEMDSESELAAVLGHEIIHAAARHGAQGQTRNLLLQGAVLAGGIAVGAAADDDRYTQVALLGGMVGAQLINQRYSRDAEREADLYGMRMMKRAGYNPVGAVELQETFVRLSEGRQSSAFDAWFASHPPSRERVENNRELLAELGASGEVGRERYQRATARLRAAQPAYDAYDEGRKALENEEPALALQKAADAIRIEPAEALFHGLKGDAHAARGDYAQAERAFSDALARNEGWFYHHLRRGMARNELERYDAARGDLAAANQRMPTAIGHYLLGTIEQRAGNRTAAIENYRVAARSDTPVGQQARQRLDAMGITGG
ncbi:M48 family metalloprotease [Wenzhouxiangella sp. XN79A]|uniref:M48 family metalloprotease n=1 Tax=Wenzhouxiangella sp. XN79A TaxID=2724193 RepID=UPI00144AEC06|nr:M48 family metalloprotease [Wenzhouxiangella sp. XN79A]NKI34344.1 M48 family metalloprotease [Wenzhouxiangella sp. XN79A]